MSNVLNFDARSDHKEPDFPVCSDYYLHFTGEHGEAMTTLLSGDETVTTACAICGRAVMLGINEFVNLGAEFELYGTSLFCHKCAEKRRAERE